MKNSNNSRWIFPKILRSTQVAVGGGTQTKKRCTNTCAAISHRAGKMDRIVNSCRRPSGSCHPGRLRSQSPKHGQQRSRVILNSAGSSRSSTTERFVAFVQRQSGKEGRKCWASCQECVWVLR